MRCWPNILSDHEALDRDTVFGSPALHCFHESYKTTMFPTFQSGGSMVGGIGTGGGPEDCGLLPSCAISGIMLFESGKPRAPPYVYQTPDPAHFVQSGGSHPGPEFYAGISGLNMETGYGVNSPL